MLPVSRVKIGRDYMEFFTVLVWATTIVIMFLAKLKAMQDVLIAIIIIILMAICNADSWASHFRFYKVFFVLRWTLFQDCLWATFLTLSWLCVHGAWPEASAPGALLHLSALFPWALCRVQSNPVVSLGLWAGGKNVMTKVQLMLRIGAQALGMILAFAIFGLYYSFRFPGQGPFRHFFGLSSTCAAAATFGLSVCHIRAVDHEDALRQAKAPSKLQ
mmetsp:Transcript_56598/g.131941  ORF Transcript_56598/g.131941 Transcript_56598/m.131941 type:complete len:217 (+) Transcript_56598:56-706(+)